jgi:hypothetical protein
VKFEGIFVQEGSSFEICFEKKEEEGKKEYVIKYHITSNIFIKKLEIKII